MTTQFFCAQPGKTAPQYPRQQQSEPDRRSKKDGQTVGHAVLRRGFDARSGHCESSSGSDRIRCAAPEILVHGDGSREANREAADFIYSRCALHRDSVPSVRMILPPVEICSFARAGALHCQAMCREFINRCNFSARNGITMRKSLKIKATKVSVSGAWLGTSQTAVPLC